MISLQWRNLADIPLPKGSTLVRPVGSTVTYLLTDVLRGHLVPCVGFL